MANSNLHTWTCRITGGQWSAFRCGGPGGHVGKLAWDRFSPVIFGRANLQDLGAASLNGSLFGPEDGSGVSPKCRHRITEGKALHYVHILWTFGHVMEH
jgi:hypothetical protein